MLRRPNRGQTRRQVACRFQFRDFAIRFPQQRLNHQDLSVQFGLQFALQVEHRGLPPQHLFGRIGQRRRSGIRRFLQFADLAICFAIPLSHFDVSTHEDPRQQDHAGEQHHLRKEGSRSQKHQSIVDCRMEGRTPRGMHFVSVDPLLSPKAVQRKIFALCRMFGLVKQIGKHGTADRLGRRRREVLRLKGLHRSIAHRGDGC